MLLFSVLSVSSQESDTSKNKLLIAGGYLKELPYLQFVKNQKTVFNNVLNLRLNFALNFSESTRFVLEMRNRWLAGDTEWGSEAFVTTLKNGNGWLNAGTAFSMGGKHSAVHIMADRFYLEHNSGKWQIKAGRQRINWGINMVSNPNDLFNTYSFFDFDYPERPGSDAVRVQYYRNGMSHIEAAFAPASHISDAVGAFLYDLNFKEYDVQFITGYYHNRFVLGTGWAGHIRAAGFKGEISLFSDLSGNDRNTNVVAAVSGDYIFDNSLYFVVEALYNGGFNPAGYNVSDLYRPLSADNIMFSEFAVTTSVSYPFSPVISGSLAAMSLPDIHAYFISPSFTWSVKSNLDASLTSQIFGGSESLGINGTAIAVIGSLQWSF